MRRTDVVRDTVRRFAHLPNRTIAQHLIANYPLLFDNDLEKARLAVRRVRGKAGERSVNPSNEPSPEKVLLPETWSKPRHDYRLHDGLWGVMSDVHIPFHAPKAVEAAVQWFKSQNVCGLFLNGDILDFAGISAWPQEHRDFGREIEAALDFFDFLRWEFDDKPLVFAPGNHEARLPRYFVSMAPELATTPLAAMEVVMGFEQRKIEFLGYRQKVKAGGLTILHGDEVSISSSVNPARGLFLRGKVSAMIGHCHRTSEHVESNLDGQLASCWSVGCLCDLSPDYRPYGNNWNWGCALVNVTNDKSKLGGFEVENRRILPSGKLK